jgi:archaemetzincin
VVVLPNADLPGNSFYRPRNRYNADSLLAFLKSGLQHREEYVLGITDKDISTKKGDIANWGVMGLGFQPGNACVISTFRIKNNLENKQQVFQRFFKVALHELGHNFGLQHCPNQHCIMVDAEGRNKLDGEESLCESCIKQLQKNGIL